MSWQSILKTIETDALAVEHVLVPIAEALYPPAAPYLAKLDTLAQAFQASLIKVQSAGPLVQAGQLQNNTVTTDFEAVLSAAEAVLKLRGETVTYDPALLQKAIASQTQAFNDFAAVKASIKFVPLAKPAQVA